MKVDVYYGDDRTMTYRAIMLNAVRVDGSWKVVIFDLEGDKIRLVDAKDVKQWEAVS